MKKILKKITAITLCVATVVSGIQVPAYGSYEENKFPYMMYAASGEEDALVIDTVYGCINGDIASAGTISVPTAMNVNGKQVITEVEIAGGTDIVEEMFFSDNTEICDTIFMEEQNINMSGSIVSATELLMKGNLNLNGAVQGGKDVILQGEVMNANNAVIMSKCGDITIDCTNVSMTGFIYAPEGTVTIHADYCNLNSIIVIADKIKLECISLNANYNSSVGWIIGGDFVSREDSENEEPGAADDIGESDNGSESGESDGKTEIDENGKTDDENETDSVEESDKTDEKTETDNSDEFENMPDETGNDIPDVLEEEENWKDFSDTDGDGLPDVVENITETSRELWDSDGDGLNDYVELLMTVTDPWVIDTDGDEISDADEDMDGDTIINIDEYGYGTHPLNPDSDEDGVDDQLELFEYDSEPMSEDTDEDGLKDGDELLHGTDIHVKDTDKDGIWDGKELFSQTYVYEGKEDDLISKVQVEMACTGNIHATTEVEDILDRDVLCSRVVGLVGSPFEITTDSEFETATIRFQLSEEYLAENELENLIFLWYDEENDKFFELVTEYDYENSMVSMVTTHFSKYMVVDKQEWFQAWFQELRYGIGGFYTNTVLAIDCSGSMDVSDPISITGSELTCARMQAAQAFLEKSLSTDKVGMVVFGDEVEVVAPLSTDKETLAKAIQYIYNFGGTDLEETLEKSLGLFTEADLKDKGRRNQIILLSDGAAAYPAEQVERAKELGVQVHTVSLGESNWEYVLEDIAEATNGEHFMAATAEELIDIYTQFGDCMIDTTDSDEDGLLDVYEVAGMRLANGEIIYTKPGDKDSDDDGLLDGEEMKMSFNMYDYYDVVDRAEFFGVKVRGASGEVEHELTYCFVMICDPNDESGDTDKDGYSDLFEVTNNKNPKQSNVQVIGLHGEYVHVIYEGTEDWEGNYSTDGRLSYGGAQKWLYEPETAEWYESEILKDGGCGLIAMADVFLYLSKQYSAYRNPLTDYVTTNSDGTYQYDKYVIYVKMLNEWYVGINRITGITALELAFAMNKYDMVCDANRKAKWGMSQELILPRIEEMLHRDIPVVLLIGPTMNGDNLALKSFENNEYKNKEETNGHFVTVTGILEDSIANTTMLRVSSWGKIYYIDYDEYIEFSNAGIGREISNNIIYMEEK